MVDGGIQGATLSYAGRTSAVSITLTGLGSEEGFAGTATDIGMGFDDITTVTGGRRRGHADRSGCRDYMDGNSRDDDR